MNNPTIEKIKKLIKLSASTNEHEAELALMKAKELATEAGIDLAMDSLKNDEETIKEEFIKQEFNAGKRHSVCQTVVSNILQNHFNVDLVYSGSRWRGRVIHFIGRKSEVELAIYVNQYLTAEFMRRWHKYKDSNNLNTKERNSYLWGLYEGLSAKLNESKKKAETD